MTQENPDYPKPGHVGGSLIRKAVQGLKEAGFTPTLESSISSHILIATSGGLDSTALASLLIKYGRRAGRKSDFTLVHINHGWRGQESDEDARFVRSFSKKLGVGCKIFRLKKTPSKGESWEEFGRRARKRIFQRLTAPNGAFPGGLVLTAHHADDLAETLLWRICTGAAKTHGGGIAWRQGREVRPFLRVRKSELEAFLREENQTWRTDQTNFEGSLQRTVIRREILPALEKTFPRAMEHLAHLALEAQSAETPENQDQSENPATPLLLLAGANGLRIRRTHWETLEKVRGNQKPTEIRLPSGWRLRSELVSQGKSCLLDSAQSVPILRWILEPSKDRE